MSPFETQTTEEEKDEAPAETEVLGFADQLDYPKQGRWQEPGTLSELRTDKWISEAGQLEVLEAQ